MKSEEEQRNLSSTTNFKELEKPTEESQNHALQRDIWKVVVVLVLLVALVIMDLRVTYLKNYPDESAVNSIDVFWIVNAGFFLVYFLIMYLGNMDPKVTKYNNLIPIIIILFALMLSKVLGLGTSGIYATLGVLILALVSFAFANLTFSLYYRWFLKHPAEKIEKKVIDLHKEAEERNTNSSEILGLTKQNLESANKLLEESNLIKDKIVVGSSSNPRDEMMEVLFKDILMSPTKLDKLIFMGTAYGAYSSDETTSSGFGFIDALRAHIEKCSQAKRSGDDKVTPFGQIRLICCSKDPNILAGKYLALSILDKLIELNEEVDYQDLRVEVVYPHQDCLAAQVYLKPTGSQPICLISPTIGLNDKEFITKNYPIGIVIKDIHGGGQSHNSARRMESHLEEYFSQGAAEIEKWTIDGSSVFIKNLKLLSSNLKTTEILELNKKISFLNENSDENSYEIKNSDISDVLSQLKRATGKY